MNKPPDYSADIKTQLLYAASADLIADLLLSVGVIVEINKNLDAYLMRWRSLPGEPPHRPKEPP